VGCTLYTFKCVERRREKETHPCSHVQYVFKMETELVNPRWVSSINTYDRHAHQNHPNNPTNLPLAALPSLLHLGRQHAPMTGRAGFCSITLSSWLIYLFVWHGPTVVVICNAKSLKLSIVFSTQQSSRKRKQHMFFSLDSCLTHWVIVCVGMILLDNLLQYLIFIPMINLYNTYDNIIVFIDKSLVIFMSCF
jgi:hypothetical protein